MKYCAIKPLTEGSAFSFGHQAEITLRGRKTTNQDHFDMYSVMHVKF